MLDTIDRYPRKRFIHEVNGFDCRLSLVTYLLFATRCKVEHEALRNAICPTKGLFHAAVPQHIPELVGSSECTPTVARTPGSARQMIFLVNHSFLTKPTRKAILLNPQSNNKHHWREHCPRVRAVACSRPRKNSSTPFCGEEFWIATQISFTVVGRLLLQRGGKERGVSFMCVVAPFLHLLVATAFFG